MKRLQILSLAISILILLCAPQQSTRAQLKPNILIITVDDMSCDSVGAFGCKIEKITPNIDRLASQGMCFDMAHVQVGNCYPSRNVMFSGMYPHNSRVEGFYQVRDIKYPVMCDLMQQAGYYAAIRGKVSHSTPYQPYGWDADLTIIEGKKKEHVKDVESYYRSTKKGIEQAKANKKPFALNINISDPHKPFWFPSDPHPVSRVIKPKEVPIPGFLFEDKIVRQELALYYSSVRRADDAVGAILKALSESGTEKNTIVIFLSDHGMPLPFAKTQLYHHSTRTPWIVKWPDSVRVGRDKTHMISAIDMLPTLCEIAGVDPPKNLQGKSIVPLLKGESQTGRNFVIKEYNENSGGVRHPIRGIETPNYLYLFNPWSDGKRRFRTATQGTKTYKRMQALAKTNEALAERLHLFDHRVLEELYDVKSDPNCLNNLANSASHKEVLKDLQAKLGAWMKTTHDPMLNAFKGRANADTLNEIMTKVDEEAAEKRAKRRKSKQKKRNAKRKPKSKQSRKDA